MFKFKKAILGVAIALVLAAAGMTIAAASSSSASGAASSQPARTQTIHLVAKQTQATLLELAAPGHGPVGNQFLGTDDLFRNGRKVGNDATACQFMADLGPAGGRFQCVATVSLPDGQLTIQGLLTQAEGGLKPFILAITGGTGAYRTAHGQVQVTPVSQTEQHYTLTIST
jgi:hypothetical protein